MWKKKATVLLTQGLFQPWRTIALRRSSSAVSRAVNSTILRSLKDHFLDATRVSSPPQMEPPEPFEVVKGAMSRGGGAVLRRSFGDGEEIRVSVDRIHGAAEEDSIGQLLVHVEVSKAKESECLHFVCGLYPDVIGIDTVFTCPKADGDSEPLVSRTVYNGPPFSDLDEPMRDAFHKYIEERGVDESLFPFLQLWLYVNDRRKLLCWLKSVAAFIKYQKSSEHA